LKESLGYNLASRKEWNERNGPSKEKVDRSKMVREEGHIDVYIPKGSGKDIGEGTPCVVRLLKNVVKGPEESGKEEVKPLFGGLTERIRGWGSEGYWRENDFVVKGQG